MTVELKVEASQPYSVFIGAGILERAAELLSVDTPELAMLVHDASLPASVVDRAEKGLGVRVVREPIAGGEDAKTMTRTEELLRSLARAGAHRHDVVVALGGGTVGDLAGFVAATYHRGMPFVQMPTTLLAQVDAAIGGKTGVNLPEGKNLAGAFHQPAGVIADVATLASLPDPEFTSGSAEIVKHGLIADPEILEMMKTEHELIGSRDPATLERLVAKAAAVKVRAVSEDETEQGSRAFLNYGHTLGHALESLGGYARWRHGEAVAIGMVFAAYLARAMGYADLVDAHRTAVREAGLPDTGADEPFERVLDAMTRDKKYRHGMRFVVLEDLGKPRLVSDVPESLVRDAYAEVTQ